MNFFDQLIIAICDSIMDDWASVGKGFYVLITVCSYIKRCVGYENWMDLVGIVSELCCFEYQWFIPRKSCILVLISRIPLSDIEMDDLTTKSSHRGVYLIDIQ